MRLLRDLKVYPVNKMTAINKKWKRKSIYLTIIKKKNKKINNKDTL